MQDTNLKSVDGIEAYLATQQAEGRYFDTSSFTIDSVKALQKLSIHQLPHSGLWLVKLVQAAVASGADSIDIKFGRKKVKVAFKPASPWQADELLETVLSGVLPADRPLMHIVTAIRASSGSATEAVSWSCGEARVDLSGQSCQVTEQPFSQDFLLSATRPSRSRSIAQTLASPLTQLIKQTVEEHDALREHCWVCPILIMIDRQKLSRGYDFFEGGYVEHSPWGVVRSWENRERYVLSACLGIRPVEDPQVGPEIPYLVSEYPINHKDEKLEVTRPVYKGEGFLRWCYDEKTCHGAVAVLAGAHADEPRVNFVLDGAVVASHLLEPWRLSAKEFLGIALSAKPRVGIRAIIGVTPDRLDLSQFAVREPDLAGLMARLSPGLEELIEQVRENLFRFYYLPFSRSKAPVVGLGIGAQVVFLTAVTQGAMLIPVAGLIAAMTAINTASWRRQVRKALGQMALKVAERP